MARLVLIFTLLFVMGCGWTTRQKALGATATTLLVVDWKQTHVITDRCTEANPVLGSCGDRMPANIYFPVVIAGMFILADIAPEWRDVLFGAMIGAQAATVWDNSTGYNAVPVW